MTDDLFLAILAMDSYNRGYDRGLAVIGWPSTLRRCSALQSAWRVYAVAVALAAIAMSLSATPVDAHSREYVVAASKGSWDIDIDQIECVSILSKRATIFGKDEFQNPDVMKLVKAVWPDKQIYRESAQCRHVLGFTILSDINWAVRHGGKPATVLMSLQVCERNPNGSINANTCSYKNVYLFRPGVKSVEAFELGLKAFARAQDESWVTMKIHPTHSGGE